MDHFDSGCDVEINDLRFQVTVGSDRQHSDCDRQIEAAGAAGAGVEVEDAFFRDEVRDVGMAVEDSGEFGGDGIEVEGLEVVQHVDVQAGVGRVFDEDDVGFGEASARTIDVDVAADGLGGSNFGEFVEDGGFAHVAAVKNAVDAGESGQDFGAEEAVGIGDDSEFHVFRISCAGGGRLKEDAHAN